MTLQKTLVTGAVGALIGGALVALVTVALPRDTPPPKVITQECPEPLAPEPQEEPSKPQVTDCDALIDGIRKAQSALKNEKDNNDDIIGVLEDLLEKSGGSSPEGKPMEWPENVPEHWSPEGFASAIENLKRQCPNLFPSSTSADCSEFPCLLRAELPVHPQSWRGPAQCQAWHDTFGNAFSLSGASLLGPNSGENYVVYVSPNAPENDPALKAHLEEYEGNIQRRFDTRMDAYIEEETTKRNQGACEDQENGDACANLAQLAEDEDPDKAESYYQEGCSYGSARSCNDLAWMRCFKQKNCDSSALEAAEEAARINPNDGRGTLDTLAYVLCQRGDTAEANAAYTRSCAAGYSNNCGRVCER